MFEWLTKPILYAFWPCLQRCAIIPVIADATHQRKCILLPWNAAESASACEIAGADENAGGMQAGGAGAANGW